MHLKRYTFVHLLKKNNTEVQSKSSRMFKHLKLETREWPHAPLRLLEDCDEKNLFSNIYAKRLLEAKTC